MITATTQQELAPQSSPVSQPTPLLFFETMHAHQRTAALKTAIDLEVFTLIGEGVGSVAGIAKRAGASERGVRAICDFLTVLGFLKKAENRYALTVDSAMFLDKNSPAYAGSAAKFLASDFLLEGFKDLTALVRAGGPAEDAAQRGVNDPIWVEFARSMAPFLYMLAERTESLLHTAGKVKILDIAAGHGLFGIAFARHNPEAEIFALDSAPVLKVAEENAERSGVLSQWHQLPGDALEMSFGTGYDVVLVPNLLHHWDRATIQSFLKKTRHSLGPNGRIVIVEFAPNDDRVSPPVAASFVMNMLVTTPAGDAYPASEYRGMLLQAGFEAPDVHPMLPLPQTVFIARTR